MKDDKVLREILLNFFQGAKVDYDSTKDKFTGVFTIDDDTITQAIKQIKESVRLDKEEIYKWFKAQEDNGAYISDVYKDKKCVIIDGEFDFDTLASHAKELIKWG